ALRHAANRGDDLDVNIRHIGRSCTDGREQVAEEAAAQRHQQQFAAKWTATLAALFHRPIDDDGVCARGGSSRGRPDLINEYFQSSTHRELPSLYFGAAPWRRRIGSLWLQRQLVPRTVVPRTQLVADAPIHPDRLESDRQVQTDAGGVGQRGARPPL